MPFAISAQQEVSRDFNAPIPKQLGLPSLERGMLDT